MSPEDHARDLIAESPDWLVKEGRGQGVPIGLTWASLIEEDREDFDQGALDRANGKEMAEGLEEAAEDSDVYTVGGYLVVRVLDQGGGVTPEGLAAAQMMCSLAGYPVLSDETHREIQELGMEQDWEEVLYEIGNGHLWVWEYDRRDVQVIDEDELPKDWEKKVTAAYHERAQNFSEDPTGDRGYYIINRSELAKALYDLGFLEGEGEDDE